MLSALLMGCKAIRKSENNLHWCLDVLFSDDECTVLDRNAAETLAVIRKNCLQQD